MPSTAQEPDGAPVLSTAAGANAAHASVMARSLVPGVPIKVQAKMVELCLTSWLLHKP